MSTDTLQLQPELNFSVNYDQALYDGSTHESCRGFMGRLRSCWDAQKGCPNYDYELTAMLHELSKCFRAHAGVREIKVDDVQLDEDIWYAGLEIQLPAILLDMILDDHFARQPHIWVHSVLMLNAGFSRAWVYCTQNHWDGPKKIVVDECFKKMPAVWDTLWKEREFLLSSADTSEPGRAIMLLRFAESVTFLAKVVYSADDYDMTSTIIATTLFAWAQAAETQPDEIQHFQDSFQVVVFYYNSVSVQHGVELPAQAILEYWSATIEPYIETIGPLKLMRAYSGALLSWSSLEGANLVGCLKALECLVLWESSCIKGVPMEHELAFPSRRAYWDVPMSFAIATALEREIDHSANSPNARVASLICSASCRLLQFTLVGLQYRKNHPPVADGRSVYKILTLCLRMLLKALVSEEKDELTLDSFTAAIAHFSVAIKGWFLLFFEDSPRTPVQSIALRRILGELSDAAKVAWARDMDLVQSWRSRFNKDSNFEKLRESWDNMGMLLRQAEATHRESPKARDKRMCSWAECRYYNQPSPTKLSTCVGCGEQKYCSRECQKQDWKQGGHREQCRRLKAQE